MALLRYSPAELIQKHEALRKSVSSSEFFRSPRHKKSQEEWCAAQFSQAYDRHFSPCAVQIEVPDPQNEVDFYLEVGSVLHPFQVTEALEPGRRRGDEYANAVPGATTLEDWSAGTDHGPEWIESAISKKLARYGKVSDLNLLVYVNFPTYELPYAAVSAKCTAVASHYASVWLLTGDALACVKTNPNLGVLPAWLGILQASPGEA